MKYFSGIIVAFIFLSLPLTACGIKPKSVDAPLENGKTVAKDDFPKQYPNK